jgi:ABC-type uncharacterized transport system substrate-binding protein
LEAGVQRRDFIRLIGATALSIPRPGYTQTQTDMPLVGLLVVQKPDMTAVNERIAALRKGLQDEGFIDGMNYSLAVRSAEGDLGRYPQLAIELGKLNARVIVIAGSLYGMDRFYRAFPNVPVVFTGQAADLIKAGVIKSYAHPGGTFTGNVQNAVGGEEAMTQKRIGLFKELVPNLRRVGMIAPTHGLLALQEIDALQKAAGRLGFEVVRYDLNTIDDVESAFAAGIRDDVTAFYISGEPLLVAHMSRITGLVAASGKPSVGTYSDWGRSGLLMSYATDLVDQFRRAGIYAGKILHGAKPGDLPVEQASKFILVINLKTAKALGITVPSTLLALADEIIE